MRKSTVLVLVLVIAALAIFLVQRAMFTRPTPVDSRAPNAVAEPEETLTRGPAQPLQAPRPERERTEAVTTAPKGNVAVAAVRLHKLRIRIAYASGREERPETLDVRISNLTGALYQPRRTGPNEFEVVEVLPGHYMVLAEARGYQSVVKRAEVAADKDESHIELTLGPERVVRVRWRASDGRPFHTAIADADIRDDFVTLDVFATRFPLSLDGPAPPAGVLGRLMNTIAIIDGPHGMRTAQDTTLHDSESKRPDLPSTPDTVGFMKLDDREPLSLSAFCAGILVAEQKLLPGDVEVVFTTPVADLSVRAAELKLVVVDDETSAPISGAKLQFDSAIFEKPTVSDANGALVQSIRSPWSKSASLTANGRVPIPIQFDLRPGESLDLGTVRLSRSGSQVAFRVLDDSGNLVSGVGFELIEFSEAGGARSALNQSSRRSSVSFGQIESQVRSDAKAPRSAANLIFDDVHPARHVLRCDSLAVGFAPRLILPFEFSNSTERAPIDIVVKPVHLASFILAQPIAPNTLIMIETSSRLPVRELTVDEFGIATTMLLGDSFRLHLVEHGRMNGDATFVVDSDPFVFEIRR